MPSARVIAYLGGKQNGLSGRIKDFTVLRVDGRVGSLIIVGGSSDGSIRLWKLQVADLKPHENQTAKHVGSLMGMYETGNRITCLKAFVMLTRPEGEDEKEESLAEDGVKSSSDGE